jgi:hypothetical protein
VTVAALVAALLVAAAAPASGQAVYIVPLADGWRLEVAPLPTAHSSESLAVNGSGLVVGDQRYGKAFHGFRWDPDTGGVELTDVGPARAVDDRGRAIVGLLDLQVQRRWEVDGSFTLCPCPIRHHPARCGGCG